MCVVAPGDAPALGQRLSDVLAAGQSGWLLCIFDLSMTILDRRPCHRPIIQAHFGFSCAWIMFVGNKGEVELCKLVQSVWVKLKCRLHSSGASWRQAQEFLKITCISVFFFHFQLATKKTKKNLDLFFLQKTG